MIQSIFFNYTKAPLPPQILQTLTTDSLNTKPVPLGKAVEECTFHFYLNSIIEN